MQEVSGFPNILPAVTLLAKPDRQAPVAPPTPQRVRLFQKEKPEVDMGRDTKRLEQRLRDRRTRTQMIETALLQAERDTLG